MTDDQPTEEQLKKAEEQFDKIDSKAILALGKMAGMEFGMKGVRGGLKASGEMVKLLGKLRKLTKKAGRAEQRGHPAEAKAFGEEAIQLIAQARSSLVTPDLIKLFDEEEKQVKTKIDEMDVLLKENESPQ